MARISGVELPKNKRMEIALTYYLWNWTEQLAVDSPAGRHQIGYQQ